MLQKPLLQRHGQNGQLQEVAAQRQERQQADVVRQEHGHHILQAEEGRQVGESLAALLAHTRREAAPHGAILALVLLHQIRDGIGQRSSVRVGVLSKQQGRVRWQISC